MVPAAVPRMRGTGLAKDGQAVGKQKQALAPGTASRME